MPWYDRPRMFYDWVRYGEDLTLEYAEWVVKKTLDSHCDSLAFCVVVGGYALWNSQVTPKYKHLGDLDLIGEMARLCKENNIHFVPWWLATASGGVEYWLKEHPSWQLVGPPTGDKPGQRNNYICYNSPYREIIYEEVREVITNYDVDAIYFDQLPGSCYCPWCQAKYEQRYGQPMPIVEDEFFVYNSPAGLPPTLREFRDESVRSFCTGIRRIVDEVNPEVVYAQNWVRNVQSHLASGLADILLPEFYQRTDLIPLGLRHRLTKTYFDHKPIWGNVRHSVRHDARHHLVDSTRMLMVDCIANMSSPIMLDLTAMDFDTTGIEDLAATFDDIGAMQDVQEGAEPVRYAALLHAFNSHLYHKDRFEEAFEGFYRLLFEAHIPFDIVNEAGVQRGELADYKLLIIPDAIALADATVAAIEKAVGDGLGLVATYMTGLLDEHGRKRTQPALAGLLGITMDDAVHYNIDAGITADPVLALTDIDGSIFHYGSTRTTHPLAAGLPEKGYFSFKGGFVICSTGDDVEVLADIHAMDHVRMSARPYNRRGHYPGPARWPLATVRSVGAAHLAYFAPQVEAEWRRAYAPELETMMLRVIEWVGGPVPITTPDCPKSVEVRLFHNASQQLSHIVLVNLTTNPLIRTGPDPAVIRYITPHKGLKLSLPVEQPITAVRSLIGSDLQHTIKDGTLNIVIPELTLYESIVVEYE